jgi:hypothetical protein
MTTNPAVDPPPPYTENEDDIVIKPGISPYSNNIVKPSAPPQTLPAFNPNSSSNINSSANDGKIKGQYISSSKCVCDSTGVQTCKAICHCEYDIHSCDSNDYHMCMCETNLEMCRGNTHICTCLKKITDCKATRHACTCDNNPNLCKSIKHKCCIPKYDFCKCNTHNGCVCGNDYLSCTNNKHVCICPNVNCRASNRIVCYDGQHKLGTNMHRCTCNQNHNSGKESIQLKIIKSSCKKSINACICKFVGPEKCVPNNFIKKHKCSCLIDPTKCWASGSVKYPHTCICVSKDEINELCVVCNSQVHSQVHSMCCTVM